MQTVLLGWLVLSMTDSSTMVGVLFAVRSAPNFFVGFAAGAMTDHLDRRLLMRLTTCGLALASWLLAGLWWLGLLSLWQVLLCTGLLGLAQASYFWLALGCVVFVNIMAAAADILHMALLQRSVTNEQRGRAMGAWVVGIGTAPLGHLAIGYLAGLGGAALALLLNGSALIVLAGVLAWALPRLRRL